MQDRMGVCRDRYVLQWQLVQPGLEREVTGGWQAGSSQGPQDLLSQ